MTADSAIRVSSSIADKLKIYVNTKGDELVNADSIKGLVNNMSLQSLKCCKESNSNVSKLSGGRDLCKNESCCNSAKNVPLLVNIFMSQFQVIILVWALISINVTFNLKPDA